MSQSIDQKDIFYHLGKIKPIPLATSPAKNTATMSRKKLLEIQFIIASHSNMPLSMALVELDNYLRSIDQVVTLT